MHKGSSEQSLMYKTLPSLLMFIIFIALSIADSAQAEQQQTKRELTQCPYGFSWRSVYGGPREVNTLGEATEIIVHFYTQKGVIIHRITEYPSFYRAKILNQMGVLIDEVIIDKRTGRIRTIY